MNHLAPHSFPERDMSISDRLAIRGLGHRAPSSPAGWGAMDRRDVYRFADGKSLGLFDSAAACAEFLGSNR